MRVPISWLREYVAELPATDQLCSRLTMSGLEVESLRTVGDVSGEGLVVARIAELDRHPNADRLTLCQVEDGSGVRPVVCGATNMHAGDHVVLALPGAVLTGGVKIKKSKIRGVTSEGMLCSEAELGLAEESPGIMVLGGGVRAGEPAGPVVGLDDEIIELGVTPNRGDCLSIRGVAREVVAVCNLEPAPVFALRTARPSEPATYTITIEDGCGCDAYRGIEIAGVRVGASPQWLQRRLQACGLRAINHVVDVTNLILMELGQPLHAFDADLLRGEEITVRRAGANEHIETLDGQARALEAGDLLICDASGPVAIAGVMGGARTAVHDGTKRIFLESAVFAPAAIRATSRRLGLVSESSYRFERGVDPAMVGEALLRAAELIAELGGGQVRGGIAKAGALSTARPPVVLRCARLDGLLGTSVGQAEVVAILERLGASIEIVSKGRLSVTTPSHRHDLTREVDLIEEVARVHGYDRFEAELPRVTMAVSRRPPLDRLLARARAELVALGLSEIVGLGFCSPARNEAFPGLHEAGSRAVDLCNPLRSDVSQLRRSIVPALIDSFHLNVRNGRRTIDLFSIGATHARMKGPIQLAVIGGLLAGPRRARRPGWAQPASFLDLKATVERVAGAAGYADALEFEPCASRSEYHPKAAARISVAGQPLGLCGMLHPLVAEQLEISQEIYIFEIDTRKLLEYAPRHPGLAPIARYPSSSRDLSLLVPVDLLAAEVVRAVHELDEGWIESVSVFDEYVGDALAPGRKALGFTMVYRSSEGTLTDAEVAGLHERVVAHLVGSLDVEVRS